ncbi:heterokaryon incompatibility protein [Rutstroemia sp. NJR-2017a BBW]|nr:heterokaryon incompatibility protein [Rutstroemia sp. NJR-2017a BBW]
MFRKLKSKLASKQGTQKAEGDRSSTTVQSSSVVQKPQNSEGAQSSKSSPRSQAVAHRSKSNEPSQSSNTTKDLPIADISHLPPLQYSPLADKEIRILTILPGQHPTPISISLEHATLSPNAAYTALSYTWGDPTAPQHPITVYPTTDLSHQHPQLLPITLTCFRALHRLRHPSSPRRFWIDAICINQSSLSERSSQVQQMGLVYKYADAVHIYLSEEDLPPSTPTGSEAAIAVLQGLQDESLSNLDRLTSEDRAAFVTLVVFKSDARDKVFALLPMLEDWDREVLPVDHRTGVEEVYERFARVLLRKNPALLVAVDHGSGLGLLVREKWFREKKWEKKKNTTDATELGTGLETGRRYCSDLANTPRGMARIHIEVLCWRGVHRSLAPS